MSHKRYHPPLDSKSKPRELLGVLAHPAVDAGLKHLKSFSRQLHSFLPMFTEEVQILERLYYKGKNQHRSAIFWRRFVEVRHFVHRLRGMDLGGLVDGFRSSFYNTPSQATAKSMKGSWTHFPDARYVRYVIERITGAYRLIGQAQDRLSAAYSYFFTEMQSGYFVQLILTMLALTSRLHALITKLRAPTETLHEICSSLTSVLHPNTAALPKHLDIAPMKKSIAIQTLGHSIAHNSTKRPDLDTATEDVGAVVARAHLNFVSSTQVPETTSKVHGVEGIVDKSSEEEDEVIHFHEETVESSAISVGLTDAGTMENTDQKSNNIGHPISIVKKRKPEGPNVSNSTTRKKKKPKVDDIDTIFGF